MKTDSPAMFRLLCRPHWWSSLSQKQQPVRNPPEQPGQFGNFTGFGSELQRVKRASERSFLFDHPSLQQLTLSHNRFSSLEVVDNGGVNSRLIALDLSHNELRGLLPAFMGSITELSALTVEHNKFTGMIPSQYAVEAAVPGPGTSPFQRLLLGGNYLFGPIPVPLLGLKEGYVNVSLVDNCLYRCPDMFFFCKGTDQKSLVDCKSFGFYIT